MTGTQAPPIGWSREIELELMVLVEHLFEVGPNAITALFGIPVKNLYSYVR